MKDEMADEEAGAIQLENRTGWLEPCDSAAAYAR